MLTKGGWQMGFGKKLYIGCLGLVVLTILILVTVTFWQTRGSYLEQGRTGIQNVSEALLRSLRMQNDILDKKLETDMAMLRAELSLSGKPMINANRRESVELTSFTGEGAGTVTLPKLMFGLDFVTLDHGIVDRVAERAGGQTAVFQAVDGKLVCVSASRQEGRQERPVGQFFQQGDPEYERIMQGDGFSGSLRLDDRMCLAAMQPVEDAASGEIIGALFVARKVLTGSLQELVRGTKVNGKGFAMAYTETGEILIEPAGLQSEINRLADFDDGRKLLGTSDGLVSFVHAGRRYHASLKRFAPWSMHFAVAVSEKEIMAGVDRAILSTAGISGLLALGAAVVIIWLLTRQIMSPLHRVAVMAKEVAGGNFNAGFEYRAKDAIGETVAAVREMVAELKSRLGFSQGLLNSLPIPCVVADEQEHIVFVNQPAVDYLEFDAKPEDLHGMTVGEFFYNDRQRTTIIGRTIESRKPVLNVQTEGTTRKGNQIYLRVDAAPLYDLDGNFIASYVLYSDMTENKKQEIRIREQNEAVLSAAENATAISEQVSTAADQLSSQVEEASNGAGKQQERVAETASSLEEMGNTVLEVSKNAAEAAESGDETKRIAQEGAQVVNGVVEAIGQIRLQAESLQTNINTLGDKAEGVGQIMNVIEDIADQTNLLALNAAIEAARAGEAGRGFAVVADEVRKLAEKTMNATKEVGQAVQEIQAGTRQNIDNTERTVSLIQESTEKATQAGQALSTIVGMVEQSADQIRSIATAVEEQSTTTEDINRAMEDINRISRETSEVMAQSSQAVNELAGQAQKLKDLMHELQAGAQA